MRPKRKEASAAMRDHANQMVIDSQATELRQLRKRIAEMAKEGKRAELQEKDEEIQRLRAKVGELERTVGALNRTRQSDIAAVTAAVEKRCDPMLDSLDRFVKDRMLSEATIKHIARKEIRSFMADAANWDPGDEA